MTLPLTTDNDDDIRREIHSDELIFGEAFAHAGERALPPGTTIYNFEGKPSTVTRVMGRRFIWATSVNYPEPHLIDWRAFTVNPDGYDEHDTLVELVIRHEETRDING